LRKRRVFVLSGAGISAESGLGTFRGSGGLWEGYRISEVATPEGWARNPEKVLQFYNERRRAVVKAVPNEAHNALRTLEDLFDVTIVTQNIDDLHERAGSSQVIHLHGEILKARSTKNERLLYDVRSKDIQIGDKCELGSQLRPHVVWFGEAVPMMELATARAREADILIVIGTSLEVYPAASLVNDVPLDAIKFLVDPAPVFVSDESIHVVTAPASEGVPRVVQELRAMMA